MPFWPRVCFFEVNYSFQFEFSDPTDINITVVEKNDSTIVLESILPPTGWDYFSVEATPGLSQSYNNGTSATLPLNMDGLTRGTLYSINVSVSVCCNCELGINQLSAAFATSCTGSTIIFEF